MIEPVRIEPEALYDDGSLRQALGLTPATLAAARRAGSLRYTRRGSGSSTKGLGSRLGWKPPPRAPRRPPEGMVPNDTSPPPQARPEAACGAFRPPAR